MKTFIFLLILIVGLYYMIFSQKEDNPVITQTMQESLSSPASTSTLEALETTDEDHVSEYAAETRYKTPRVTASGVSGSHSLPTIEEDMTFLQLKSMIHTINPSYPLENITLNSPLASLLPTQTARERFVREVSAQFSISEHDARSALGQKRLLWDWVNLFRE